MRALIFTLALLAATPAPAQTVTATIPLLAGIIGDITRGVSATESLLPANSEAHQFSLNPSQIKSISEAPVIFAVGNNMEPWLLRVEPHLAPGAVVKLGELDSVAALTLKARSFSGAASGDFDPHQWMDPDIIDIWAQEIAARLLAVSPESAADIEANLASLRADITGINTQLQTLAAQFENREISIVVSHDAYQYLERNLGLDQAGMLSDINDNAAGARSLSELSRLEGNICFVIDPNETLPKGILSQATRASIDPLGIAYLGQENYTRSFFGGVIAALETCLQSE